MRRSFMWSGVLATGFFGTSGSTFADGPALFQLVTATAKAPASSGMVTKVFAVDELVCLPANSVTDGPKARMSDTASVELCADRLMSQITAMIAPGTWVVDGGPGRIEFFEKSHSLVVCHTPETVDRIATALERLKKRQGTTVSFTCQIVHLPAEACSASLKTIGQKFAVNVPGTAIATLSREEVRTFLGSLSGNLAAKAVSLPAVTVFHGQTATVSVGEEKPTIVNRTYALANGTAYSIPDASSSRWVGMKVSVCPLVAPDRKSMRVRLNWLTCAEQPKVITLNSGSKVTLASFQDGKPAGPAQVDMTQTAQPFQLKTSQSAFEIRDGKTQLIDMGLSRSSAGNEHCYLLLTANVVAAAGPEHATCVMISPPRTAFASQPLMPAPPVAVSPMTTLTAPQIPPAPPTAVFNTPQVHAEMLIVKLSPEAAKKQGLTDEVSFFDAKQIEGFRSVFTAKCPGCEVMSAPQMMLMDNQVGYMQCGAVDANMQPNSIGGYIPPFAVPEPAVTRMLRVTPTISADQRYVRLKLEAECSDKCPDECDVAKKCNVELVVTDGGTAVIPVTPEKGSKAKSDGRVFLVVTPHLLRSPQEREKVKCEIVEGQAVTTLPMPAVYSQPVLSPVPAQAVLMVSPPMPAQLNDGGPQVLTRSYLVRMTPEVAKKHGLVAKETFLDEKQVAALLSELSLKNPGCEEISASQMLLRDKQVGCFEDNLADGSQGKTLQLTPTFSADRRFVRMEIVAKCAQPAGHSIIQKSDCNVVTTLTDGATVAVPLDAKPTSANRTFLIVTPRIILSQQQKNGLTVEMKNGLTVGRTAPAASATVCPMPVQGMALTQVGCCQADSTLTDRKAKAVEWVNAYEKACAGAAGPSPMECAMRALAEDPNCFAKPAKK